MTREQQIWYGGKEGWESVLECEYLLLRGWLSREFDKARRELGLLPCQLSANQQIAA